MIDQRERAPSIAPTDANDPTHRIDAAEPIDPIEHTEPTLPIDRIEPFDAIESTEFSDHSDQRLTR